MLRLTRELVNQGLDGRQQLMDLLMQINLMEGYATLQGKPIDKDLAKQLAQLSGYIKRPAGQKAIEEVKALDDASIATAIELAFEVHGRLSELVKPATPESLEASAPRAGWYARIKWPRVTDVLIATTFVGVIAFAVGIWLKGTWTNAAPQIAYLGAALLGASFSGLFTAYKFVQCRTFDPASGSSYMVRVVLGTVSGLILANIGSSLISPAGTQTTGALAALGPGTLALVGGYSADAVNLILQRIADTLVTTVRGNSDDAIKAKQAQLEAESKSTDFEQRQATVVALSDMLKNATDDTLKNNIQTLMTAVGQGNVGEILKPVKTNGKANGNSAAANSEVVKAAQNGSNGDAVAMAPGETPAPVSDPPSDEPAQDAVTVGAEEPQKL